MLLSPSRLIRMAGSLVNETAAVDAAEFLARTCMRSVGERDATRWSAAFVHYAGYWSHFDYAIERPAWPLPATGNCDELGAFARFHGVLSPRLPVSGDVFLLWSTTRRRFVHAGIVVIAEHFAPLSGNPARYACHTIEGNVTPEGKIGGDRLMRMQRILSPVRGDRTIRWPALGAAPFDDLRLHIAA